VDEPIHDMAFDAEEQNGPVLWVFTARKRDVGAADFDRRPYVSLERQGKATPPSLAT